MSWQAEFTQLSISHHDQQPELSISLLDNLGMITLSGDDRKSYLHGQVTCDVVALKPDQLTFGAHCDPKGKVWSAFRLFHYQLDNQPNDQSSEQSNKQPSLALLQEQTAIEADLRELKKYGVFSKVTIDQADVVILGIAGESAGDFINQRYAQTASTFEALPAVFSQQDETVVQIDAQRWVMITTATQVPKLIAQAHTLNTVTAALTTHHFWDRLDIAAGYPLLSVAEQNQHLPQALNLQALDGISFKKGCYTGQEMVARAKYRGINKRALFIVEGNMIPEEKVAEDITEKDTGDIANKNELLTLERQVGENWRSAGTLLSQFIFNDNHATGLIILPNDLPLDTPLRLTGAPNTNWHILPLPYALDDES